MIAAISPAAFNYDETLSTLRFAQNVSCISNKSKANVDEEGATIQRMLAEIEELKRLIEEKKKALASGEATEEDLLEIQEIMNHKLNNMNDDDVDEEELIERGKTLKSMRTKVFQDAGLDEDEIGDAFGQDPDAIQMINISNDPSLAGCMIYFPKEGKNTIGTGKKSTIHMQGLGMGEEHARLTVSDKFGKMMIEPVKANDFKVTVNGNKITGPTEVKHLDRVVFGHGNGFKIVIPKQSSGNEE